MTGGKIGDLWFMIACQKLVFFKRTCHHDDKEIHTGYTTSFQDNYVSQISYFSSEVK